MAGLVLQGKGALLNVLLELLECVWSVLGSILMYVNIHGWEMIWVKEDFYQERFV